MSIATMTVPGLYRYALDVHNIDIFGDVVSGVNIPATISKDTLIDNILMRSMPFEAIYPEPEYMKAAVKTWFDAHARTFLKWGEALEIDYNPLENYNRVEVEGETTLNNSQRSDTTKRHNDSTRALETETEAEAKNKSDVVGAENSLNSTVGNTTNAVSAYDTSAWSNADKSDTSNSTTDKKNTLQSTQGSDANSGSMYESGVESETEDQSVKGSQTDTGDRQRRSKISGNIGVTTSQQMLEAELKVQEWNIYGHITDLFIDDFCVLLY